MKDLQKFVTLLKQHGELLIVNVPVDTELEITEIVDRLCKDSRFNKAVLFTNTGTQLPLLINYLGSEKRMALALGCNSLDELSLRVNEVLNTFLEPKNNWRSKLAILPDLYRASKFFPKRIRGRGRCQEIVMKEPDLSLLPVLKCWPNDGGKFITLPCVHTIHPETGAPNVGMYRMQIFSRNTAGMHWHKHKTGAFHYSLYRKLGRKMPVTVTLGGDPTYTFAATAPLPENIDEYLLSGFLRQKSVRLVKCLTNDIWIPEDVDIVIEGFVDPQEELVLEGPFGDHTGFYSLPDYYPLMHVTAITYRADAIYPATIVGIPPMEDAYIAEATERIFTPLIKATLAPEVKDMHMPIWGVAHNLVLVSLSSTFEGQAFKVAQAFWGAGQMMFNKVLVAFDETQDIRDYGSLISSIMKCFIGSERILFSKGPLDVLDHASTVTGFGSKLCLDLTNLTNTPGQLQLRFLFSSDLSSATVDSVSASSNTTEVVILLEPELEHLPDGIKLWYLLNNIDPLRDITVSEMDFKCLLVIDGRRKSVQKKWPNVITMSPRIIQKVDSRWCEYFNVEFIPSPSLRIFPLKVGEGAEI